jgi:hypothetical protein
MSADGMADDVIAQLRRRGADGRWLAGVVAHFLAGEPLAEALGAEKPDGAAVRRRLRDDALKALAAHFPGSIAGRVKEVRRAIRRYETTRWRRVDRHRASMPAAYVGTLDQFLFEALAAGCGKVPLGRTRLYEILWPDQALARSLVSGRAEPDNAR